MSDSYVVTGASGFVGGAICEELIGAGESVTAVVRQSSETARLQSLGVTIAVGDLRDRGSLIDAFRGADTVIHSAALVSDWAPRKLFFDVNVEGTRNVLDACAAADVKRILHVSSVEVFGHENRHSYPEQSPYRCGPGWYGVTKTLSEQLVRGEMEKGSLEAAIVYPTWVYGPGDRTFVTELIAALNDGSLPYLRDGGEYQIGLVYIYNLTAAVRTILGSPKGMGGRYILNDDPPVTFRRFVEELASRIGARPPRMSLPYGLAYFAAAAMEAGSRLVGRTKRPLLTRQSVASLGNHCEYDTSAVRDLGYTQPHHFPDTLDATLQRDT